LTDEKQLDLDVRLRKLASQRPGLQSLYSMFGLTLPSHTAENDDGTLTITFTSRIGAPQTEIDAGLVLRDLVVSTLIQSGGSEEEVEQKLNGTGGREPVGLLTTDEIKALQAVELGPDDR